MFAKGPVFQLVNIDLTIAGTKDFNDKTGVLIFVRAEDAGKAEVLGAKVNVMLGDITADVLPMTSNTIIRCRAPVGMLRFTWDAQPGVTAYILLSVNDDVMIQSPPSRQLVTSASSNVLTASAITVGTAAGLASAASATRQKLTLINNSAAAKVYLGADATVTAANGFPLPPGGGFTFEGTTAAVWAISDTAGADVRILAEG